MAEAGLNFDQLDGDIDTEHQLQPHLEFKINSNMNSESNQSNNSLKDNQNLFKLPPPPREPHVRKVSSDNDESDKNQSRIESNLKHSSTPEVPNGQVQGSHPVYYNSGNGNVVVTSEETASTNENKTRVIQTAIPFPHNEPQRWRHSERQRPLTAKRLRLLKIFGIIAAVVFFPLGIPAALYAFKAEKELHDGILKGNIDEAQKCAKRSERLIIFSWMFAILVAVLVFALVERSLLSNEDKNSVRNRVLPP